MSWGAIYISLVNGENVDVAGGGASENNVKQLTHCDLLPERVQTLPSEDAGC
jgi:hypothetical protein